MGNCKPFSLCPSPSFKKPAAKLCDDLITRSYHNGLILLSCGKSTVRFMPPLMISKADVDEAVVMLEASLNEVLAASAN